MSDVTIKLSDEAKAYIELYEPATYGINIPKLTAQELMDAGLIEWVPPTAWSGKIYGLTKEGRKYRGFP